MIALWMHTFLYTLFMLISVSWNFITLCFNYIQPAAIFTNDIKISIASIFHTTISLGIIISDKVFSIRQQSIIRQVLISLFIITIIVIIAFLYTHT